MTVTDVDSSTFRNLPLRTLLIVDVENVAGRPTGPTGTDVRIIATALDRAFGHQQCHTVVACAHRNASRVWFNWPTARKLVRSGPDGADRCLLEVLAGERVENRFGTIVIASGDGIFAREAARLTAQGVKVVVALGRGKCARRLRKAARHVVHLPLPQLNPPTQPVPIDEEEESACPNSTPPTTPSTWPSA